MGFDQDRAAAHRAGRYACSARPASRPAARARVALPVVAQPERQIEQALLLHVLAAAERRRPRGRRPAEPPRSSRLLRRPGRADDDPEEATPARLRRVIRARAASRVVGACHASSRKTTHRLARLRELARGGRRRASRRRRCSRKSSRVTTPKLPPPPRSAQKSSASCVLAGIDARCRLRSRPPRRSRLSHESP